MGLCEYWKKTAFFFISLKDVRTVDKCLRNMVILKSCGFKIKKEKVLYLPWLIKALEKLLLGYK